MAPVDAITDVSVLVNSRENQWFDRKSSRIAPADLAKAMIGLANADGGRLVIGISNGRVEGIASNIGFVNDWTQAGRDHADPPVRNTVNFLDCVNEHGAPDQVLVVDVEASETIHRTRKGECYLRVGDETRRLGPVEERELAFDKGEATFDKTIVQDATLQDLDVDSIRDYAARMGSTNMSSLMRIRGIYIDQGSRPGVTQAGQLLFGFTTPLWSYIRYQQYDGIVAETGIRSNLRKDIRLEGPIPKILADAQQLLVKEIGTVIRLNKTGRFTPEPALPEFAWLEAVVNALTHRSYSLHGDGIHVRQFSDRLEVQSPGRLPGLVRVENIKNVRFSRNPHIARVLAEMTDYVRELNEGVPRMFREMEDAGLRAPEFRITDATVTVLLYKQADLKNTRQESATLLNPLRTSLGRRGWQQLRAIWQALSLPEGLSTAQLADVLSVSRFTARQYLSALLEHGLVAHNAQSLTDPRGKWHVIDATQWGEVFHMLDGKPAE